MPFQSLLIILIVGGTAGWLAGLVFTGSGFGRGVDILAGIVGGFMGTWLLEHLGVSMPGGVIVASILAALLGACALLLLALVVHRAFPKTRR